MSSSGPTGAKPRSPLIVGVVCALGGAAAAALFTPLLEPILKRAGTSLADAILPASSQVSILACAPLKEARTILSVITPKGPRVMADESRPVRNDTVVYFENTSGQPLRNATVTIYPLRFGPEKPTLMLARGGFTSINGSADYKFSYDVKGSTMELSMPILNPREAAVFELTYFVPVGFIVEVFADGMSERQVFKPGCPSDIRLRESIGRSTSVYEGPGCKIIADPKDVEAPARSQCIVDNNVPFQMTEEIKGQTLKVEEMIVADRLKVRGHE